MLSDPAVLFFLYDPLISSSIVSEQSLYKYAGCSIQMFVLNSWASLLSAEEKCFVHLKTWSSCLCKMLQFWSLTCVSNDTFFHIAVSWGYVVFWSNLNLMVFLLFLPFILLCNFLVFFLFLVVVFLFVCFFVSLFFTSR